MLIFLLSITPESDKSKIEYIFNRYHEKMLRLVLIKLRGTKSADPETKAEDVVQAVFMKLTRNSDTINSISSEPALRAYIYTTVVNEVINRLKEDKIYDELVSIDDIPDDEDFIERLVIKESYDAVVRAIAEMDEIYCITLSYYFLNELTVKEIAELMGVSEKTVYTRIARGKQILLKKCRGIL